MRLAANSAASNARRRTSAHRRPMNPPVMNANAFVKAICNPSFHQQQRFMTPESTAEPVRPPLTVGQKAETSWGRICLLYTSDAADERSSVDLGGRRIIKKK